MVNPWGGVEALLTHAISTLLDVPAAHAPMVESMAVARQDLGMVDARTAAEAISTGFFMCVLKGLQRSPRIETDPIRMMTAAMLAAIKGGIAPSTLVRPLPAMALAPLPLHRKANVSEIFAQRESRRYAGALTRLPKHGLADKPNRPARRSRHSKRSAGRTGYSDG